jgi:hypothetical protein
MKFAHGANVGSTDVTWSATFVPVCDMGPPEDIKQIAILVFKALACVAIKGNVVHLNLLPTWQLPY